MQLTTREDPLRQGFGKAHKAFALRVNLIFLIIYTIGNTRGVRGREPLLTGGRESEAERQGRRSVMQSQDEGLGYPTEREER
jgi:hypothetical protein